MNNIYIKYSDEGSLTHYGVKGMKWRKRKKKTEMSEREMYDAGGSNRLNRLRPFHDDGEVPQKGGYLRGQYNPSIKGTIENRKRLWNAGYYTRREGTLTAKRSITKTLQSAGKSSLSKSKKAISKGFSFFKNKFKKKPKGYMYVFDGSKLDKNGRPKRVKQAYY